MKTENTRTLEAAQYFTAEMPDDLKQFCLAAIEKQETDRWLIKENLLKSLKNNRIENGYEYA